MLRLTLALTMIAMSATAADFRELNIGEACGTAREWEAAKGSTLISDRTGADAEIIAFKGWDFGRDLFFSYFCQHGELFTGNYYFPIESSEQVANTYREIHATLLSAYGDTFMDNSPWRSDGDPRFILKNGTRYITSWRTSRLNINLTVIPNQKNENSGLRVFLIIGPLRSSSTQAH